MIDDLTILAILPLVVVIVFGLRWTKPVGAVRVPVSVTEPLRIYHQPEPLPEPVHVFETPAVAYTDETVTLAPNVLSFLEGL